MNASPLPVPDRPHHAFWPQRVPRDLATPDTTLWANLDITARRYPSRVGLRFLGRELTWSQVHRDAERLAGWLQQEAGVQRGDRVMVVLQNSPQFIIACYAILRADAVVVPVNPMSRADELTHYILDPQVKVAIGAADGLAQILGANAQLPDEHQLRRVLVVRYDEGLPEGWERGFSVPPAWTSWLCARAELPEGASDWSQALAADCRPGPHQSGPDDLMVLCYTSGTTGKPKGCMHTHRSVMHNVLSFTAWTNGQAADVSLAVVPMFHVTGMQFAMHQPVYCGQTLVILPRWDRDLAGEAISRYRVSSWTNIPTMIIDLLASPHFDRYDLSSLRYIGGGGAAMPQAIAERLKSAYGLNYCEGYGLTETAAPSHSNPPDAPKLQCLGIPFPGTDARIVDPDTLQEVPAGTQGEIVIHGPQVFKGYWQRPADTAAVFFELEGKSFFRTGDLGTMDADGYFFITDRLKRMINASGFKVWPAEVEAMLYKHPAVQEACIIAAVDAYRGETVKAMIVLRPAARETTTPEDIIAWARERMSAYKVPRVVDFIDELPKSGSGKVMWRLLQEKERAASPAG